MINSPRLRRLVRWTKRGFDLCLILVFLAIVLTLVLVFGPEPAFTAEARFQRVNDSALRQMGNETISDNLSVFRRRMRTDLTSREAVIDLIEGLELTRGFPRGRNDLLTPEGVEQREALIERIQDHIEIEEEIYVDDLDQILVRYTDTSSRLASDIVNRLVENYIKSTREEMDKMLLSARDFFAREVTKFSGRISELEKKQLDFDRDHPGLDPHSPNSLRSALEERQMELTRVRKELRELEQRNVEPVIALVEAPDSGEARESVTNDRLLRLTREELRDLISELEQERAGLEVEREELESWIETQPLMLTEFEETLVDGVVTKRTVMKPNTLRIEATRDLGRLTAAIRANERLARDAAQAITTKAIIEYRDRMQTLRSLRDDLTLEIEDLEIQERNYFQVRNEYLKIENELLEAQKQFAFWDANLQRTQVALQTEVSQRGVRLRQIERAELGKPRAIWAWAPWLVDARQLARTLILGRDSTGSFPERLLNG